MLQQSEFETCLVNKASSRPARGEEKREGKVRRSEEEMQWSTWNNGKYRNVNCCSLLVEKT